MKDILIDLVGNMIGMTDKIDKMQETIDYINKTFHETHEPMFKLEETLGNMTVSLGNLKQNLNTINKTLTDFKEFLKTFDDTVFNIDDVIKHIDDTLNNLANAAKYVEFSVLDLNGTAGGVKGDLLDINSTLGYVNKSAFDVTYTSAYSNDILGSMKNTLHSLEQAVHGLNLKVNSVIEGSDVISVSLKDINSTVVNTRAKLYRLHDKLDGFNSSMRNISSTVRKLNDTYYQINKTLESMNEPYSFINGTVLHVITQLSEMDDKLSGLNISMVGLKTNMTNMNDTLVYSIDWLKDMDIILNDFNVQRGNETITVSLQTKNVIQTIGVLIEMNGTLTGIGSKVDGINTELDQMENKLDNLGQSLENLARTLDNIDTAFKILNTTLKVVNETVNETVYSVDRMNGRVQRINMSIIEMNVSFDNINETLNIVNATTSAVEVSVKDVNEKLLSMNHTFKELIQSTNEEEKTSKRLFSIVSNFDGPTSDLNKKLHNANESLRILRSKADIMEESNKILNETILNTQAIVTELLTKINQTRDNLVKTNVSLKSVNRSIDAMDVSYSNISDNLSRLIKSFENMNMSLANVGPAFPNMMSSVFNAKDSMDVLLNKANAVKDNLTTSVTTRDMLVDRHITLSTLLEELSDDVDDVLKFVHNIQNRSKVAGTEIENLKQNVIKTTSKYKSAEKNIQFINSTHDGLYNLFQTLKNGKKNADVNLGFLNNSIEEIKTILKDEEKLQNNYPNLNASTGELQAQLAEQLDIYQDIIKEYEIWTNKFQNTDGLLWNQFGHPLGVYEQFKELLNKTNYVNDTLLRYAAIVQNISSQKDVVSEFGNKTKNLIAQTKTLRNHIDNINSKAESLEAKTNDIKYDISNGQRSVESMIAALEKKLLDAKALRDTFGNVNGTMQNTNIYDDIIRNITSEIYFLHDVLRQLVEAENEFQLMARQHREIFDKFNESVFDVNERSEEFLKDILLASDEADIKLVNMSSILAKLRKVIENSNETMGFIDNRLNATESDLKQLKEKSDFVGAHRENLKKDFEFTLNNVNRSNANYSDLAKMINQLREKGLQIKSESGDSLLHNIEIDIEKEMKTLDLTDSKLASGSDETRDIGNKLASLYAQLSNLDETNYHLDVIKEKYKTYNESVNAFKRKLEKFDSFMEVANNELLGISDTFTNILKTLTLARKTYREIDLSKDSLDRIEINITDVSGKLSDTQSHLNSLDEKFTTMNYNYKNFTDTDIDLSKSYVNDALKEHLRLMSNLSEEFGQVNSTATYTFEMFQGLLSNLANRSLNRYNSDSILNSEIIPQLTETTSNVKSMDNSLNFILNKLNKMQLIVDGINDTIHVTNMQLFEDKQKKMLADTHFADMKNDQILLNQSLFDADARIKNATKKVDNAMTAFKSLKKKLSLFPNVNFTIDAIDEKIAGYNAKLKALQKKLLKSQQELNNVNSFLWIDGAMYSDNETIQDVQNRYKHVQQMLDDLQDVVNAMDQDLLIAQNGTDAVMQEIETINTSLDDLENIDKRTNTLISLLTDQHVKFEDTNRMVDDIIFNMSVIESASNALANRFQHINRTVLNKKYESFNKGLFDGNKELTHLSSGVDTLSTNLGIAKELVEKSVLLRNASIATEGNLTQQLETRMELLQNLSTLANTITDDFDMVGNGSNLIRQSISNLENMLRGMKDTFSRKEKEEYFNSKFPGHQYGSYKGKLEDLFKLIVGQEKVLQQVVKEYSALTRKINNTEYIEFNTTALLDSLTSLNESLLITKDQFNEMKAKYLDAEKLLRAPDGTFVSNDETLQEMKNRYKRLINTLTKLDDGMLTLRETIDTDRTLIVSTNSSVQNLIDLIEEFIFTQTSTRDLQNNTKALWNDVKDQIDKTNQLQDRFNRSEIGYLNLLFKFNDTSTPEMEALKGTINVSIRSLELALRDLLAENEKGNVTLFEQMQNIAQFEDRLLQNFHHSKTLRLVLQEFDKVDNFTKAVYITINSTVSVILIKTETAEKELDELDKKINYLRRLLLTQQKIDYINETEPSLQQLLSESSDWKDRAEELVQNKTRYLQLFETLLNRTEKRIKTEGLLDIPLDMLNNHQQILMSNLAESKNRFENASELLNRLNFSLANRDAEYFDLSLPISTIRDSFVQIVDSFMQIKKAYEYVENLINISTDPFTDLLNTERVIDMFMELRERSVAAAGGLDELKGNISDTDTLLKKVRRKLKENTKAFTKMLSRFSNVTNKQIKNQTDNIRKILEEQVGLRLPLGENLVNKKLLDNYYIVTNHFNDTIAVFNQTHTNTTKLDKILEQVEDNLANITMETEIMKNDNMYFRAEIDSNLDLLNASDKLLRLLESMLIKQKKFDILNDNIPVLKEEMKKVKLDLEEMISVAYNVSSELKDTESFRKHLDNISGTLDSVNIPTDQQRNTIEFNLDTIKKVEIDYHKEKQTLETMPIWNVSVDEIVENKNITVKNIKELTADAKTVIDSAKAAVSILSDRLQRLTNTSADIGKELNLLNESIVQFMAFKDDFNSQNYIYDEVLKTKAESIRALLQANKTLEEFELSFKDLKAAHKNSDYNTSLIEERIQNANNTIRSLLKIQDFGSNNLTNAYELMAEIAKDLFKNVTRRTKLQNIMQTVKPPMQNTTENLLNANKSFLFILKNVPTVNTSMFMAIEADINEMKTSLNLEEEKRTVQKGNLPQLEKKYEHINVNFDITNRTMVKIADEIENLKQSVEALRNRINTFRTINISTSDMSDNVTYLENRVSIMQDNYNNVQEILNTLRADIDNHSIIGRNISLNDVHIQYAAFNKSLDLAEEVLSKIEVESFEMTNYFDLLNDTVFAVNTALDRFESKEKKTRNMSKNINSLGGKLEKTTDNLLEIESIFKELGASFDDMQQKYKDVFNKTAENNTLIMDLLNNTGQTVKDIGVFINGLKQNLNKSTLTFSKMNDTLFKDIHNYIDLTNTLADVKDAYTDISLSLKRLEEDIDGAQLNTSELNPSITEISELLKGLDKSLFMEQTKHDFLQNNFADLSQKLKGLDSPTDVTNKGIINASARLNSTFSILTNLANTINKQPNVNIALDNDFQTLDIMDANVAKFLDKLKEITRALAKLHRNATSLVDTNLNVTEIKSRYDAINSSLDQMINDIRTMDGLLADINANSSTISEGAKKLTEKLEAFGALNTAAIKKQETIANLSVAVKNNDEVLRKSNITVNDLLNKLEHMKSAYDNVTDIKMQQKLTELIKKVKSSLADLERMKSIQSQLANEVTETNNSIMQTIGQLQTKITSKAELDNIIYLANQSLFGDIANQTDKLQYTQLDLEEEMAKLTNNLLQLTSESAVLQKRFTEEDLKQSFIRDKLPDLFNQLNEVEKHMTLSNETLIRAIDRINKTDLDLSDLSNRLNSIVEINIPLNDEYQQLNDIRAKMKKALGTYNNISGAYDKIDIDQLKNRSLSSQDISTLYNIVKDQISNMTDNLKNIQGLSKDIDNSNNYLKDTIRDINETVDHYVEVHVKLEATKEKSRLISGELATTNSTVSEMAKELQDMENTFDDIVYSFRHVKDDNLLNSTNEIQQMIQSTKNTISELKLSLSSLFQDSNKTEDDISKLNATLVSTKTLLDELKRHIAEANRSTGLTDREVDRIDATHTNFNASIATLSPQLKEILQKILELNETYVKEQRKRTFSSNQKPLLERRFADLQGALEKTNKRLSLTEVQLTDLKYLINVQSEELQKFPQLDIKTDPEAEVWQQLSNKTARLFDLFTNISSKYSDVQNVIATIDERGVDLTALKTKYQKINETLHHIENVTNDINRQVDSVLQKNNDTEKVLKQFTETMNKLRSLQTLTKNTNDALATSKSTAKKIGDTIQTAEVLNSSLPKSLDQMETQYSPLKNASWEKKLIETRGEIDMQNKNIQQIKSTFTKLDSELTGMDSAYNKTLSTFNKATLTRATADKTLANVTASFTALNSNLTTTATRLSDVEKHAIKENKYMTDLQTIIKNLNDTLYIELEKFNFVNKHLPLTKKKYQRVNASLNANFPEVEKMKSQIQNLVTIIDQIKEKMKLFGLGDTDTSVANWDNMIKKLNATVTSAVTNNQESVKKMEELKGVLWSNSTIYSKNESLAELRMRFEEYNKTLDGMNTSMHAIQIKLGNVNKEAGELVVLLNERDSILTTTPATTTPSGPPDCKF